MPDISERRAGDTTFLHSGLKNAAAQTSTSETVGATRQYDAFGNVISDTGSWSGPFGYAGAFGYQADADIPFQQVGHRWLDPSTAQFLTRDPINDGRSWYSYGGGNSAMTSSADPEGLMAVVLANPAEFMLNYEHTYGPILPKPTLCAYWTCHQFCLKRASTWEGCKWYNHSGTAVETDDTLVCAHYAK